MIGQSLFEAAQAPSAVSGPDRCPRRTNWPAPAGRPPAASRPDALSRPALPLTGLRHRSRPPAHRHRRRAGSPLWQPRYGAERVSPLPRRRQALVGLAVHRERVGARPAGQGRRQRVLRHADPAPHARPPQPRPDPHPSGNGFDNPVCSVHGRLAAAEERDARRQRHHRPAPAGRGRPWSRSSVLALARHDLQCRRTALPARGMRSGSQPYRLRPAFFGDPHHIREVAGCWTRPDAWSGFVDSGVQMHVVPAVGVQQCLTPYAFQSEACLLGDAAGCEIHR
ncbi:hypothetical protein SAMN02787144_10444 [Streptomyces atratus]|uniref:Uncharacterized protein n=1 Tax=Streptomyces atratus TaxID=1893 RepID=A0A1K2F8W6_STRAR|nr:hypothetical protein SAMN02787144_10444 [Streptomyces atratus]